MDTNIPIGSGFSLQMSAVDAQHFHARAEELRQRGWHSATLEIVQRVQIVFSDGNTSEPPQGPGAVWRQRAKRWQAYRYVQGRFQHIGYFRDRDDALAARRALDESLLLHAARKAAGQAL